MGFYYMWGAELTPQNEPKRCILFSYCPSLCCIHADNYLCCHLCVYLVELENLCMIHLWTWKWLCMICWCRPDAPPLCFILFKHDHVYIIICFYCSTNIQNGHDFYKHSQVFEGQIIAFWLKICPDKDCVVTFLTFVLLTIKKKKKLCNM